MSQGMTQAPTTQMATAAEEKLSNWVRVPAIRQRLLAALNESMNADFFFAQIEISFQDPEVQKCTPRSQFEALHRCAAMGLLPSLDQVALIPRWNKDAKVNELDVMPEWRGYKAIMERHPLVLTVDVQLIHVNDTYSFEDGILKHSFDPFAADRVIRSEKDIKGGYMTITWRDGRPPKYHFCTLDYIQKCRSCAEFDAIWKKWYEQQARKTIFNSGYRANHVPVDIAVEAHMSVVIQADNQLLGNDPNRVPSSGAPAALPPTQSRAQQLAQQYLEPRKEEPQQEQRQETVESSDSIPEDNSPNQDGELSDFEAAKQDIEAAKHPVACQTAYNNWCDPDAQNTLTQDEVSELGRLKDAKIATFPKDPPRKKKDSGQQGLNLEA